MQYHAINQIYGVVRHKDILRVYINFISLYIYIYHRIIIIFVIELLIEYYIYNIDSNFLFHSHFGGIPHLQTQPYIAISPLFQMSGGIFARAMARKPGAPWSSMGDTLW